MRIIKMETCQNCPYLEISISEPEVGKDKIYYQIYFDCIRSGRRIGEVSCLQVKDWKWLIPDWCPLDEVKQVSLEKEMKKEFCNELHYLLEDVLAVFQGKMSWKIEHILNQVYPLLEDLKKMCRSGQYENFSQTILELENLWGSACCEIPNLMYQAVKETAKEILEYEMGRKEEFSRITRLIRLARGEAK